MHVLVVWRVWWKILKYLNLARVQQAQATVTSSWAPFVWSLFLAPSSLQSLLLLPLKLRCLSCSVFSSIVSQSTLFCFSSLLPLLLMSHFALFSLLPSFYSILSSLSLYSLFSIRSPFSTDSSPYYLIFLRPPLSTALSLVSYLCLLPPSPPYSFLSLLALLFTAFTQLPQPSSFTALALCTILSFLSFLSPSSPLCFLTSQRQARDTLTCCRVRSLLKDTTDPAAKPKSFVR